MSKYDNLVEKTFKFIIILEIIGIFILIILNTKVNNDSTTQKSFYENKKINELIPVSPDNELMAKKYFSDFVNLTIYEPEYAYEHVADYYKEKVYPTYEYFKNNILKINYFSNMIEYLQFKDYILLYIILIGMSYLISKRYSRKVFDKSAIKTLKEEV